MNSMDLLNGLNNVQDRYVLDVQSFRQGKKKVRRLPKRKLWLIAAIVVLTLLLVGCAVVYALRMQDLKVGEYSFYVPTEYDEEGNVIPVESQEPIVLLSLQGTNLEALKEWVAFTNTYDRDGAIALEADLAAKSGTPWDIPENMQLTYGCYSQEMVDKLEKIVEKYHLKLLSSFIPLNYDENSILFQSLGVNGLIEEAPNVQVEYWDGDLHLEGTFDLNMYINANMGSWKWERGSASYRYSLKDYFDPITGGMLESTDYTQWNYTRKDGKKVLLVLSDGSARIYADLPEAFVSIGLDPVIWVDGQQVPMTKAALEALSELFDLSIQPKPTTMEEAQKYRAEVEAKRAEARAAAEAEREAMYTAGYQEFVDYWLETAPNPEGLSYVLYDVNGDGVEELVIGGRDILSMKDGQSYRYFDLMDTGVIIAHFRPCEGNTFEVYCEDLGMFQHYFYQANGDGAAFLTGVSYDASDDTWYLHLEDGAYSENRQKITEAEARKIINTYPPVDIHWMPLKRFGEAPVSIDDPNPYARFLAERLLRYEDAKNDTYAKMDLNGDGVQELLLCRSGGNRMDIYTIRDGECQLYADSVSYICEGNILEKREEDQDQGRYYGFYRCGAEGPELIEKVVRDPYTLYWGYARAGTGRKNCPGGTGHGGAGVLPAHGIGNAADIPVQPAVKSTTLYKTPFSNYN